jgi:flavin-dependent dehydrogenase
VTAEAKAYDVCIVGAGMAGLTLARQLRARKPDLSIAVLEHRRFPVSEGTHKVGESTVEIAAHYLAETLQLKDHLTQGQLPKFGLRMFMRGAAAITDDLSRYDEIGVSQVLPVPTYQVDRGRLENYLAQTCAADGIELLAGTTLRSIDLRPGAHRLVVRDETCEQTLIARYLVDGTGRRSWLRGQLGLTRPARHENHAVWFRINGEIDIDQLSSDQAWRRRCLGTPRRLSTNHFTGPGYWLWLIPLASNSTSVGLVFDPKIVAADEVNQHSRLVRWLEQEHPLIAASLSERVPLDFHFLKGYAVTSKQVFSDSGWMLTGDAGVFADPFYSPGADFIAFANGYITELIAANLDAEHYRKFQTYFMAFFSNTLSLYRGQYGGFGDRDMMVLKTLWDYSYYWGPLAKLFFTGRYTDTRYMDQVQPLLLRAAALNSGVQRKFRNMSQSQQRIGGQERFFDHNELPWFHQLKHELIRGDSLDAEQELAASVTRLQTLSTLLEQWHVGLEQGRSLPSSTDMGQLPVFV